MTWSISSELRKENLALCRPLMAAWKTSWGWDVYPPNWKGLRSKYLYIPGGFLRISEPSTVGCA